MRATHKHVSEKEKLFRLQRAYELVCNYSPRTANTKLSEEFGLKRSGADYWLGKARKQLSYDMDMDKMRASAIGILVRQLDRTDLKAREELLLYDRIAAIVGMNAPTKVQLTSTDPAKILEEIANDPPPAP